MLDLFFTLGLMQSNLRIKYIFVSDHKSIVFDIPLIAEKPKKCSTQIDNWAYDASTADQLNYFNYLCSSTLDSIAPVKIRTRSVGNQAP